MRVRPRARIEIGHLLPDVSEKSRLGWGRTLRSGFGLVLAVLALTAPGLASGDAATLRLAIAPFEGESLQAPLSERLAAIFAEEPHARLLAPGSFVAEPGLTASAEAVRGWAYNAAVDDVLLGRVVSPGPGAKPRLELVLRSGHSGAERWRYLEEMPDVLPTSASGVDAQEAMLRSIAQAVRSEVGASGVEEEDPVGRPPAVEGSAEPAAKPSPGRGLEGGLDLAGFRNDAPIEINAEEAEIVNGDLGRELVFRRNVEVRQANVTLRSDLLEATYLKGRSEPERLVAQGHVLVDQGGRRARCDRAIYQRTAQRLTCAGRAELVQGCDVVRGDSIEFDLADDRARVQGAASIVIRPGDGDGCVDAGGLL